MGRFVVITLILIPTVFFGIWYRNRIPIESVLAHVNGSFILVQDLERDREAGLTLEGAVDKAIDRRLMELEAEKAGLSVQVVEGFFDVFDQWNPAPGQVEAVRKREGISADSYETVAVLSQRLKARAKAQYLKELRSKAVIEKYIP